MILRKDQIPAALRGSRILVKPDPPVEDSQLIVKPDDQKFRPNKGVLIAAGLAALDQMYDHGDQIGDEVWWGKFAGVIEEWDHIEDEKPNSAKCDHLWVRQPPPHVQSRKWECSNCESTRLAEHMLIINIDDVLANVSLQRRIENGEVAVSRGKTSDNRTRYYLDRKDR